jgi:23S rRNA pseudouridine1911/1915/1917 synthase
VERSEAVDEIIPAALDGERLDRVVALLCAVSRREASELVTAGAVTVGGVPVTVRSAKVSTGDRVGIDRPSAASDGLPGPTPDPDVGLAVVHADDAVIVVDKPAGLVVHPGAGNPTGTLVHGLMARFPDIAGVGGPERPGIVHRLDKGTSGLLVVARTLDAYADLVEQLASRRVSREYLALVWGRFDATRGMVDAPIGRSARAATRMAVTADGREARTGYEVIGRYERPVEASLLRCRLETGRTHQIRVHLAAIDHPVVGDADYGGRRASFRVDRPFLHASRLVFVHPSTGETMSFESPLPADLAGVLERLS